MGIERIKNILVKRDGISENEAYNCIEDAREAIIAAAATCNSSELEEIIYDYLGLEPDYILDLLY